MSSPKELPHLVSELTDMSKQYLRQETLEPAKKLGRVAGMGVAAGLLFAIGALLLAIAVMRLLVGWLPDSELWSALGYGLATLLLAAVAGLIIWRASR